MLFAAPQKSNWQFPAEIFMSNVGPVHLAKHKVQVQISNPPYSGEIIHTPRPPFFFSRCDGDSRWRVCYQRGLPRLVSLPIK